MAQPKPSANVPANKRRLPTFRGHRVKPGAPLGAPSLTRWPGKAAEHMCEAREGEAAAATSYATAPFFLFAGGGGL